MEAYGQDFPESAKAIRLLRKVPAARRTRSIATRIRFSGLVLGVLLVVRPAHAATFWVDDTRDRIDLAPGDGFCIAAGNICTLRAAIEEANALAGADVINFNIGGGGPQTISPGSFLPTITETVTIDGTTQTGFAGAPIIEVNGASSGGANGLTLSGAGSSGSTIKGLVIGQFNNAIRILVGTSGNFILGNYIGTDKAGTAPNANTVGVLILNSANNQVGGTLAGNPNIVSGNSLDGIQITGAASTLNRIEGNYIGVDASGATAMGNAATGVAIYGGAVNNTVGGTAAGAGNVISGNGNIGVAFGQAGTTGNLVEGNFIGTDAAGTAAVPNWYGVALQATSSGNIIGAAAGSGNVISGNNANGILIDNSSGNTIQKNRIGTDVSGTADLGNVDHGIHILNGSNNNVIGGAGLGNVISGNDIRGVDMGGGSSGNVFEDNIIGRDATNTASIPNSGGGIHLDSSNNTVGGIGANDGNIIAGNNGYGVAVTGTATGNTILRNSIFSNAGGLGIDLNSDGVTANDENDGDSGPNDLLNWPFIYQVTESAGTLTAYFSLSVPAGSYRIEFFKNPSGADPSGNGEGEVFADSLDVTYVGPGFESFSHSFPGVLGEVLTATATFCTDGAICAAFGNTSELGNAFIQGVTAVELTSFTAVARDGAVDLHWQTASELDNVGFHLYRSTADAGPYARLTDRAIPGLGSSPTGAEYSYRDEGLTNGVTYFYKLEDIDATGKTTLHGPVYATPRAGATEDESTEEHETEAIAVGDPASSELRIVERRANAVVLELATGGFYAEPQGDGTFRLEVPGFDTTTEIGSPSLPVRRTWVEALAGRKVSLISVRTFEEKSFTRFIPHAAGEPAIEVSRRGSVRASQRRTGRARVAQTVGLYPPAAAQILSVGFQEDVKKALVEMAPLRWDGSRLVLAHRLVVHIGFRSRDTGDITRAGFRGRRYRRRPSHRDRQVIARFVTEQEGLYGVTFEETFGRGRRPSIGSRTLSVSRGGGPVPFYILPDPETFAPGSTVYFFGEGAADNRYGNQAVYELEVGTAAGKLMPVVAAPPNGSPLGFYRQKVEKEENHLYQPSLLQAPDIWLWSMLFAPATQSYSFDVDALAPASVSSRLTLWLQGATDFSADPDHHVRVFVNGSFVGETSWNGKAPQTLELDILPAVLREGENVLQVENVGDTAASSSMVILNRFSVDYPRLALADTGRLQGSWSASGTAEVKGLSSASFLLRLDTAGPVWLTGAQDTATGLKFGVEAGKHYLAVAPEAVLRVREVRKPLRVVLKTTRNAADYVMIGPRDFLDAATALLQLRGEQGLGTLAVTFEQIVSEFGFGEPTPEAIRDFLSYAYHQWRQPPRYVLLLGDTSFDFKDYLDAPMKSQLPSLMMKTSYLWTVSDPALAAVNGDDLLPDLAIGRLPAADVSELEAMVAKLLAYESSGQSLADRIVLVTDNPDKAGNFDADADALAAGVLSGLDVTKVYLSRLGTFGTRNAIRQAFNDGTSLMSYIGHGAIHLWADENVFNIDTVATLNPQARQSVLLTMNCLNGYFHFPFFDSLAESLLKATDKGSIAAFSPSGLSLNSSAHVFHEALLEQLLNGGHARLGDAVLAARADYADAGALPDMLAIYHLFGDPALTLESAVK